MLGDLRRPAGPARPPPRRRSAAGTSPRCRDGATMPASRRSTPSTGMPVASRRATTSSACRCGAGLVQDHAGDPGVRVEGAPGRARPRRPSGTPGRCRRPARPGAAISRATCAVEAKPSPPSRPSYRPITPSTTATSAGADRGAVQQQRHQPVLADEERVEVAAGPAGGQRVVAGVDVVGADLVPAGSSPSAPQRGHQPGGDGGLAVPGGRRGDRPAGARSTGHHSMPRWPFWPASIGCLTLVISVTRSAISSSFGSARRPVMTTCWWPGRAPASRRRRRRRPSPS